MLCHKNLGVDVSGGRTLWRLLDFLIYLVQLRIHVILYMSYVYIVVLRTVYI